MSRDYIHNFSIESSQHRSLTSILNSFANSFVFSSNSAHSGTILWLLSLSRRCPGHCGDWLDAFRSLFDTSHLKWQILTLCKCSTCLNLHLGQKKIKDRFFKQNVSMCSTQILSIQHNSCFDTVQTEQLLSARSRKLSSWQCPDSTQCCMTISLLSWTVS